MQNLIDKGYFVELNDFSLVLARCSALRTPFVIEDIREVPLDNKGGLEEAVQAVFPETQGGTARVLASLRPKQRRLRLASGDEAKRFASLESLTGMFTDPSLADMSPGEFTAVYTRDGLAISGQGAPWLLAAAAKDSYEQALNLLQELKLVPGRVSPASLSAVGGVTSALKFKGDGTPALVFEFGETATHILLVTGNGVEAVRPAAVTMDKVAEAVQVELGLKYKGSAAKLFFNADYDFSETGPKIAARIAQELASDISALGGSPATFICTGLPAKQDWFAQGLAKALNLSPLAFDLKDWGPQNGVTFASSTESSLTPAWLSFLSFVGSFQPAAPERSIWQPDWTRATPPPAAAAAPAPAPAPVAKPAPAVVTPPARPAAPAATIPPARPAAPAPAPVRPTPATPPVRPAAPTPVKPAPMTTSTPAKPAAPAPVRPAAAVTPPARPAAPVTPAKPAPAAATPPAKPATPPAPAKPAPAPAAPLPRKETPAPAKPAPAPAAAPLAKPIPAPAAHAPAEAKSSFIKSPAGLIAIAAAVIVIGVAAYFVNNSRQQAAAAAEAAHQAAVQQAAAAAAAKAAQQKADADAAALKKAQEDAASQLAAAQAAAKAAEQRAETEAAAHLAAARGKINIATNPPGATVAVGNLPPRTSPALFEDLKLGHYPVTITLKNYDPVKLDLEVTEDTITDPGIVKLNHQLGSLDITSDPPGSNYDVRPAGSRLFVDPSEKRSGTTPASFDDLPAGDYVVSFSRDGFASHSEDVTVDHGSVARVAWKFTNGNVIITSTPSGATVTSNGRVLGVTPLTLSNIVSGDVSYDLDLVGYDTTTVSGKVEGGMTLKLAASMLSVDRLANLNDLDVRPQPIPKTMEQPSIPTGIGAEGTVEIALTVDRSGDTKDAQIVRNTTKNDEVARDCLDAVSKWKFKPGMIDGKAVNVRVTVPFTIGGGQ